MLKSSNDHSVAVVRRNVAWNSRIALTGDDLWLIDRALNAFTCCMQAQQISLNYHCKCEQFVHFASGGFFNFNGTAGLQYTSPAHQHTNSCCISFRWWTVEILELSPS